MPTRRPNDDLEARVTALEHKVRDITHDAAAARVLAGAADRDVSELRTELRCHTTVLNALRETQLEQGDKIVALDAKVDSLDSKVASLDSKVNEGFAKVNVGMAQITALLTNKISDSEE